MFEAWLAAVVYLLDGPAQCSAVGVGEGLVATAYHCVAEGGRPRLRWRDGKEARGRVVVRDPRHDLALVAVDCVGMPVLPLRREDPVVGERVYGLGHPFGAAAVGRLEGTLRWSVSEGIVSAVGDWFVQTDTALNPGNSGGPVVDVEGRVVGIASRKLRADNLAFLARSVDLQALVDRAAAGSAGPVLGGGVGVDAAVMVGDRAWAGPELWVAARDRAVLRGLVGLAPWDGDRPLHALATAEARVRVGTGSTALTLDLGGGVEADEGARPVLVGHLGTAGITAGVAWAPPERRFTATLGVAWPGRLGVW